MVSPRRGASSLGCLFSLLIFAAVGYFGVNAGESYWRFYQYQDDMRQEVNFAAQRTNDQIIARLRASADSLGLPDDAQASPFDALANHLDRGRVRRSRRAADVREGDPFPPARRRTALSVRSARPARRSHGLGSGARRGARRRRGRVVFTNGVFDLLHPGHVDVLARRAAGRRASSSA